MPSLFKCSFISLGRIALILAALQLAACNSPEDRAQTYYERGMKLVAQEDYVKASLSLEMLCSSKRISSRHGELSRTSSSATRIGKA